MSANRLEDILEECVSAHLEGRRSVEDSLSLYPSLSAELAPLLRTAVSIAESFQSYSPPAYVQINIRARFLAEAAARVRGRTLTQRLAAPRAVPWQRRHWGFLAAAAAAVAVVVVGGSAIGLNVGGGSDSLVRQETQGISGPITPAVSSLRQQIDQIKLRASQGQPIETEAIQKLSDDTQSISAIGHLNEIDRRALEKTIQDQYTFLQALAATSSVPVQADAVRDALGVTESTAGKLGIALPVITPEPASTPGPTVAPTSTPAPPTPVATPTPAATPEPSPTVAPEPTATPGDGGGPTSTPSVREPLGGAP